MASQHLDKDSMEREISLLYTYRKSLDEKGPADQQKLQKIQDRVEELQRLIRLTEQPQQRSQDHTMSSRFPNLPAISVPHPPHPPTDLTPKNNGYTDGQFNKSTAAIPGEQRAGPITYPTLPPAGPTLSPCFAGMKRLRPPSPTEASNRSKSQRTTPSYSGPSTPGTSGSFGSTLELERKFSEGMGYIHANNEDSPMTLAEGNDLQDGLARGTFQSGVSTFPSQEQMNAGGDSNGYHVSQHRPMQANQPEVIDLSMSDDEIAPAQSGTLGEQHSTTSRPSVPPVQPNMDPFIELDLAYTGVQNVDAGGTYGQYAAVPAHAAVMQHPQWVAPVYQPYAGEGIIDLVDGAEDEEDDDDDLVYIGRRQLPGYRPRDYLDDYTGDALQLQEKEDLGKLLENIRPDEDHPEDREPTPHQMSIELKEHQKLGLAWMRKMEEGTNKGGILADDMGLGKTIQAIALMVARPSTNPRVKTTLVVAPVALLRQWNSEIKDKLKKEYGLSVFRFHAGKRKYDFKDLARFDVVLTTYGTLSQELKKKEKIEMARLANPSYQPPPKDRLVFIGPECKWYRVILDEAQNIKNKNTRSAQAARMLQAQTRFCMTGTPMMNNISELYSLISFLRIRPYNDFRRFQHDIARPASGARDYPDSAKGTAMKKLQALLKAIMLRRTKTATIDGQPIIRLPPKEELAVQTRFSADEWDLYKALETSSQARFTRYVNAGTVMKQYAHVLVLLLRLRQACCHPHLIKDLSVEAGIVEGVGQENMDRHARALDPGTVTRLRAVDAFECPICYDASINPTIFVPCGHDACSECFSRLADPTAELERRGDLPRCPSCRSDLDPKKVIDYRTFCKIHHPLRYRELFAPDEEDEDEEESDEKTDSESDSDEETDEDDEDETLGGFILPDDAEEDDDQSNTTSNDELNDAAGLSNAAEAETELPQAQATSSKGKGKGKAKAKKSRGRTTHKKTAKGKDKGKGNAPVTLAQLRQEGQKNAKAKERYLKRLRKTFVSSAKIDECMRLLEEIRTNDPTEKTIIFSQFTSLLDLLEIPISAASLRYQRYDGGMSATARADAVDTFMTHPSCNVMLISLKAGNAGLNLNRASQVIILDPFWNPYIEDQAVDRAHRFPQDRTVRVHRLLVPETVEDRIVELQRKKKELISMALDENAARGMARLSMSDLSYLFGLS